MSGSGGVDVSLTDWRGSGQILVVDDESVVLNVTEAILRRFGFEVLKARNGREGVDCFTRHADTVRAAVVDMTMPLLSGPDTCRELVRLCPDLPVIMTSGTSVEDNNQDLDDLGAAAFLQKPYPPTRLIELLRDLLQS